MKVPVLSVILRKYVMIYSPLWIQSCLYKVLYFVVILSTYTWKITEFLYVIHDSFHLQTTLHSSAHIWCFLPQFLEYQGTVTHNLRATRLLNQIPKFLPILKFWDLYTQRLGIGGVRRTNSYQLAQNPPQISMFSRLQHCTVKMVTCTLLRFISGNIGIY